MALTKTQQSSLAGAAKAAVNVEGTSRVPAALTMAQWAIESGWGKFAPGNNCFGIKASSTSPGRQLLTTKEWFTEAELRAFLAVGGGRTAAPVSPAQSRGARRLYTVKDWFAAYETLDACFAEHARLLSSGSFYRAAFQQYLKDHKVEAYARAIAVHYSTTPSYADAVLSIMRNADVVAALQSSKAKPAPA